MNYTLKNPKPLGDNDPKYGQTFRVRLGRSGKVAVIDVADYSLVSQYSWYLDDKGYARGHIDGKRVRLHTLILGKAEKGIVCDHINQNKLDNRRVNLRHITRQANQYNSGLWKNNTSGIKGVSWDGNRKRWRVFLGRNTVHKRFKTLDEAISTRREAERKYS